MKKRIETVVNGQKMYLFYDAGNHRYSLSSNVKWACEFTQEEAQEVLDKWLSSANKTAYHFMIMPTGN